MPKMRNHDLKVLEEKLMHHLDKKLSSVFPSKHRLTDYPDQFLVTISSEDNLYMISIQSKSSQSASMGMYRCFAKFHCLEDLLDTVYQMCYDESQKVKSLASFALGK